MKRLALFFLVVGASLLSSLVTFSLVSSSVIIAAVSYPVSFEATDEKVMGFNVNPDGLHFSRVPRGALAERWISVSSEEDAIATVMLSGDAASYIRHESNVRIKANETRKISFIASPPTDAQIRVYNGTATVILRKA